MHHHPHQSNVHTSTASTAFNRCDVSFTAPVQRLQHRRAVISASCTSMPSDLGVELAMPLDEKALRRHLNSACTALRNGESSEIVFLTDHLQKSHQVSILLFVLIVCCCNQHNSFFLFYVQRRMIC